MALARSKFVVLPILLLGSWTVLGAQARAAGPRTVHFGPIMVAPNDTLRNALAETMRRFRLRIAQVQFIDSEKKADYAFVDLSILNTPSILSLSVNYRGPDAALKPIYAECEKHCDAAQIEGLFYELLDQTLLDPSDGLYRPMRIRQCEQMTGTLSFIRATVEPSNDMALEKSLPYVIAEPVGATGTRWQSRRVTPRFDIGQLDAGNASATFRLIGNAKMISVFLTRDCSTPMRPLAMQPRIALLTSGERNPNVSTGN